MNEQVIQVKHVGDLQCPRSQIPYSAIISLNTVKNMFEGMHFTILMEIMLNSNEFKIFYLITHHNSNSCILKIL